MKYRRQMIQQIVELLKKREGAASPEWLQKLPQMVKQLEVALYRSAPTFEAYFDKTTLKQRLQSLAKEISSKSNEDKSRSKMSNDVSTAVSTDKDSIHIPQNMPMNTGNSTGPYSTDPRFVNTSSRQPDAMPSNSVQRMMENNQDTMSREQKDRLRHKQERLLLLHHSSKCTKQDGTCTTPYCLEMKQLWTHMAKCENASCQIAHCYSSRTILSHYRKCRDNKCPVCSPVKAHIWREKNRNKSGSVPEHKSSTPPTPTSMSTSMSTSHAPVMTQSHSNHLPQTAQMLPSVTSNGPMPVPSSQFPGHPPYGYGAYPPPYGAAGPNYSAPYNQIPSTALNAPSNDTVVTKPVQTTSTDRSLTQENAFSQDDSQSQMEKIRHKQQRLLLLRHASKCDAPDGTCEVTQHCSEMKKLWHHISRCQKNDCDVMHCLSSRYVLIHYRKCKDARCAACAPVRDAIKRGHQDKKRKLDPSPPQSAPPIPKVSGVSPMPKRVKKEEVALVPSLINSLTTEQIDTHVKLLNREFKLSAKDLKDKCMKVLRVLRDHEHGWVFNCPVDPVELGLPDYFDIIKNPMDLGTINKKLEKGEYTSVEAFDKDVRLTFDNAMLYNELNSPVHTMAKTLMEIHCDLFKALVADIKKEEDERRKNERACSLCGEEKRLFEPPVFFCSGMNCTNTRIRRQQFFYVSGHAQYNWCNSCYNELDDKLPIELPESQIYKRDLVKKKNNEEPEENWVACDDCERWVHQICGLFNARQNKDSDVKYSCPKCLLKRRKSGTAKQTEKLPGAADLPKTVFSEWLQNHVNKKIKWKFENLALEKAQNESIPFDEAYKEITSGGKITIRQVTSTDRKLEVRERMLKRYEHKNYPDHFPFRCKCILVFQELDGVDVILFALYVYEHGEDNPAPNTRTVYISYLDSVHYMRPPKLRTFVYHEILIAYLDYARRRGFASAHIWACPPMKGDDYIFFAKPPDQKTPRDAMLQKWYIDMLTECQKRGIVGKLSNMYDLYFKSDGSDATIVPYLEGDYFSGEIENVIKDLEDGDKAAGSKDKEKKKKNVDKTKKMRKGTRSGGLEDDFITGDEGKNGGKDLVMVEIGKIIKPMKDSFIVAFLNWEGATPEHMQVSKDVLLERERRKKEDPDNIVSGHSLPKTDDSSDTTNEPGKSSESKDEKDRAEKKSQIIDDDAEEMDCEILENRQAFLNLCRAPNHYQFDELRRSKHTSMMILWHLHNRDAAKFIPCCFSCSKEILSGIRYTCVTCADFDLCQDCYRNPKTNRGTCTHKLIPKAVDGENGQNPQLTEAQRRDRKKHIKLHIQLLEHASVCDSTKCTSANCKKMKQYLQHSKECKIKQQGGCKVCKRILTLLKYHAQSCKNTHCPIPQCRVIRERIRLMARQQQAMDDRRRQMMNQNFRGQPATS
jgi:E1A/CREB-binding protein